MSKQKKRTRIVADNSAASKLTITEFSYKKGEKEYTSFRVQGWKENGKWQKRQFKNEDDAKTFAATKEIQMKNKGRAVRMVNTSLTDKQTQEAQTAFDRLGDCYSLTEAIDFFFKSHRPSDFEITLPEAVKIYLDGCEEAGIRPRTIIGKKSVLSIFCKEAGELKVHEVTEATILKFLRGLRGKDGMTKASRKTWNNYRNELSHFFKWASEKDLSTDRPWCFLNPVEDTRLYTAKQVRAEQGSSITTTDLDQVSHLLTVALRWRGACLAKCFALAYFAGIRPDGELRKLALREKELINLKTRTIEIPAEVSKTNEERKITICDSLAEWLKALEDKPIIPKNFDRIMRKFRKHFGITHDETRHSFISYHVALHRSVGEAALQAGNSESIVKKNYLRLHPREEGEAYFSIVPDAKTRRAVTTTLRPDPNPKTLRAI